MKIKIINILVTLFFFLLLISCNVFKNKEISGIYVLETKLGNEYIKLNNDSTFNFICQIPLIQSESTGNWFIKDKKLIIKSFIKYNNDYIEVEELLRDKGFVIQIVDSENEGIYGIPININNDSSYMVTDINGEIFIKDYEFKQGDLIKIYMASLSSKKGIYRLNCIDNCNYIKIKIHIKEPHKKYFNNDTLNIRNNKIILNKQAYVKKSNSTDGNGAN